MQVLEVETEKLLSLIVISDSLGELGSSVAHAIRLQFPDLFAATQRFPFVSSTCRAAALTYSVTKSELSRGHPRPT